jgi:hypothetical protein
MGGSLLVMHKSGIFCIKDVIISQANNSHGNQEIFILMIGMSMNKVQKHFLEVKEHQIRTEEPGTRKTPREDLKG